MGLIDRGGTEAPCEMNTYFPQFQALWMAENCTGTLHNLCTLRGAQVRDGNAWAKYILEAIALFGRDAQVVFQSHNWPHWGNDIIRTYMENTAGATRTCPRLWNCDRAIRASLRRPLQARIRSRLI
jgi:alkyl sulfatase BDS1-like metallo-beta-lactamase superfamily hydrolase